MDNKDRMLEILKDTVEFYGEDPRERRCVDEDSNCRYTVDGVDGKDDTHCAVGRYLKRDFQTEDWIENEMGIKELCSWGDDNSIDWCLRDEAKGLHTQFWVKLQDFHDSRHYWNGVLIAGTTSDEETKGLSENGQSVYKAIVSDIKKGHFDD